ncbi:rhodanese [Candidatus Saccharibacteria bacterium]|nr:MAG: rhodanese [Candidatus Saccharibacteria bacterium]
MQQFIVIAVLAIITVGGILVLRADGNDSARQTASQSVRAEENTSQEATTLPEGTVIYDVRTVKEYDAGHVADAKLLSIGEIQNGSLPDEGVDAPIAVYCRSGNRSGQATAILRQAGYTNIIDMGGLNDLQKFGLSVK